MVLSFWNEWKSPSAAYRGKPFWSWNGELDKRELIRQAKIFKKMGMGGYFMHSRTGLRTEYLGPKWFDCINACADAGDKMGMESWLYDEDRWPSGSAGGLATKEERFRMKYLRLRVFSPQEEKVVWPEEERFVAAFSADLKKLTLESYRPLRYRGRPSPGRSILVFSWEPMGEHSFYNGQAYLDTMSKEATENFLKITHDAYKKSCGKRLGKSIKGIFTDEPHRGFVFCDTHGQPGNEDSAWITPFTPQLWDDFQKAFGYDLRKRLPELFLRPSKHKISPVKWQYMELCQRLFLENWARPMQERCHKHGLTLTGHVLHEDSLAAQAVPCGSMIRYYEFLDYPGVDILKLQNENYWVVKQLSSAARQLGKPWLLSELYGCSGWQTDFEDHKRIGDWQALFGINLRCHHLSWYTMGGEAKRDFPASISFQSAWFKEYKAVETYFSRLHVLLQAGEPLCDVLVLNPIESLWAQIRVGWATWLSSVDKDVLKLEKIYQKIFTWLSESQIDFDYGDEDFLQRLAVVEGDSIRIGRMSYKVIVVAGMETLRSSTLEILKAFESKGGQIVFAGPPPSYLDALPSNAVLTFQKKCKAVPLSAQSLVKAVRERSGVTSRVKISEKGRGLFGQIRKNGDQWIIVLLNPSTEKSYSDLELAVATDGPVTELDCLRGHTTTVKVTPRGKGSVSWKTSFLPLQERVFVCGADLPGTKSLPPPATLNPISHEGKFYYELDEPNIAVLDRAEFSINGGSWQDAREVLRVEEAICAELNLALRGGQMIQPWASGKQDSKEATPVRLRYSFEVKSLPDSPVQLLLENHANVGISLNGNPVKVPGKTSWFIDPCFRTIPLPEGLLRKGHNAITLDFAYQSGTDIEAIYLLGSFGVEALKGGITLAGLPKRLGFGDWTKSGLPFYSGKITLKIPVGKASQLQIEPMGAATLCFRHPRKSSRRIIPWKPFHCHLKGLVDEDGYVAVEWILTRRNTFGPLHLVPIQQRNIGPASFRSSGNDWSDEHQLVPTGLCQIHLSD